ncbi:MAG: UDP-3-O-(3-hydroxymyristoyl)glucosamine N-acyltransferase [Nitrospinota bacterium]|nr:UDP-3-O-(3-hydroxymyristoyl)glucosamine N-acyltransferase [Nitrospinota bacterium]
MKLSEIAKAVGGSITGDGNIDISRCASAEKAGTGDITFVENRKFLSSLERKSGEKPSAVIVGEGMGESVADIASIETKQPMLAFVAVMKILHSEKFGYSGVHPTAFVDKTATLGDGVAVGPLAFVGAGAVIGKNSVIHPNATVGAGCRIGDDCVIHSGAQVIHATVMGDRCIVGAGTVIGSDGFKYTAGESSEPVKVPHIGIVRIGDDVEFGANCAIDRAFLDETVIESGVKLDNLVHVAHNVSIGERSLIAGQNGIAGSTRIGRGTMTGGQVGFADHITIGDGFIFAAQSGVIGDMDKPGIYAGLPAIPIMQWRRSAASMLKLPELIRKVRKLEKADDNEGD